MTGITSLSFSVGILLAIWFGPLASLRRDNFRSDIRRLRDSLFDYMRDHGHDFSDPSYRRVRQFLNGLLRLSNHITPVSFIITVCYNWDSDEKLSLVSSVQDHELRDRLETTVKLARQRALHFTFLEGGCGLIINAIRSVALALHTARNLRTAIGKKAEQFFISAYNLGGSTIPAAYRELFKAGPARRLWPAT